MSDAATGTVPDGEVVSIAKADLALLVRAADLLNTLNNDGDVKAGDLAAWGISNVREPTALERALDPDLDEVVELSNAVWSAMERAADLTGLDLSSLGMDDENADKPEMAEA